LDLSKSITIADEVDTFRSITWPASVIPSLANFDIRKLSEIRVLNQNTDNILAICLVADQQVAYFDTETKAFSVGDGKIIEGQVILNGRGIRYMPDEVNYGCTQKGTFRNGFLRKGLVHFDDGKWMTGTWNDGIKFTGQCISDKGIANSYKNDGIVGQFTGTLEDIFGQKHEYQDGKEVFSVVPTLQSQESKEP